MADIESIKRAFLDKLLEREDIKKEYLEFVKSHLNIEDRVKLTAKDLLCLISPMDMDFYIEEYYDRYDIDEYQIVKDSLSIFEDEINKMIREYDVNGLINLLLAFYIIDDFKIDASYFVNSYDEWVREWLKEQIEKVCKYIDFSEFKEKIFYLLKKFEADEGFTCIYLQIFKGLEKEFYENVLYLPDFVKLKVYIYYKMYDEAKKIVLKTSSKEIVDMYLSEKKDLYLISKLDISKFYNEILKHCEETEYVSKALAYKCVQELDFESYKRLKTVNEKECVWVKEECEKFLTAGHIRYLAEIYEYEKNYNEILKLAQKQDYIFRDLAKKIKHIYPEETLEIVKKFALKTVNSPDKNREKYKIIVRRLKELEDVESIKKDIYEFAYFLYKRKPVLPALRDELKKAGLVK
ncbi:hypothetical protein [Nautilia sp.]